MPTPNAHTSAPTPSTRRSNGGCARPATQNKRREEARTARIIHIAERVRDELYDQYADDKRRAVGD